MMIKPNKLRKGSTIGIIAPAGPIINAERIKKGVDVLKRLGFNVVEGENIYSKKGYFSSGDGQRADEFNSFFESDGIDAVLCLRGGYGTLRILDKINYSTISANPKVFIGYSDITALHIAINKMCNMVTFHGPMLNSDFGGDIDEYTLNSFLRCVTDETPIGEFENPREYGELKVLYPGTGCGRLVGGNLTVMVSTIGTPFEIDLDGSILFIEDVGEEPYRVDRMLTQLILGGKMDNCRGIVLGQWTHCSSNNPDRSFTLEEVFADRLIPLKIPILYNAAIGHQKMKATLPYGVNAMITNDGRLIIKEGGVV